MDDCDNTLLKQDAKAGIVSRLFALEQRLARAEAELEIRNLITRYSLAADCGDAEAAAACHAEDAIYIVSSPCAGRSAEEGAEHGKADLVLEGRQAIAQMLLSPLHQSLLPDCAHTVGPFVVKVSDDRATTTGYSRLYRQGKEQFGLMRLSINKWKFKKQKGIWLITSRESRPMGTQEAQNVLRNLL